MNRNKELTKPNKHMNNHVFHSMILVIITIFTAAPALALPPWPEALRGNWREIHSPDPLPPFCKHRYSPTSTYPKIKSGTLLSGLNHFCEAKTKKHICLNYIGSKRKSCLLYLAKAADDPINNALSTGKKNHPLLPYLYTEYADFLADAREYHKAISQYLKSIKLNRHYLPAYVKLANAFVKLEEYDKAEKTLKYALKIQKNKRYEIYIKKRLARIAKLKMKSR